MTAYRDSLAPEALAEINEAADEQYDARPGEPLSPSRATQIRPLIFAALDEPQAA